MNFFVPKSCSSSALRPSALQEVHEKGIERRRHIPGLTPIGFAERRASSILSTLLLRSGSFPGVGGNSGVRRQGRTCKDEMVQNLVLVLICGYLRRSTDFCGYLRRRTDLMAACAGGGGWKLIDYKSKLRTNLGKTVPRCSKAQIRARFYCRFALEPRLTGAPAPIAGSPSGDN